MVALAWFEENEVREKFYFTNKTSELKQRGKLDYWVDSSASNSYISIHLWRQFQSSSVKSSIIIIGKGDYKYLPRIVMTFGNTRINLLLHDTFQLALEVFSSELLFFP